MDLQRLQQQLDQSARTLPPVEKWNPAFCGDIDMCIKHDGSWHYMGTPITRDALVRLFAGVLVREENAYFLVTPVEKVGIQVEDVPFVVTTWQQQEDALVFETSVGDRMVVSQAHPVMLQADKTTGHQLPYIKVRRNLWARLHQNVFYQLVELGQDSDVDGQKHLVCTSGDYRFSLGVLE